MSWLRHDEPSLADIQLDGGELISVEDLASRNKQLEALLATEQDAHSQSKITVNQLKLVERDCLYRLQVEAARASKAEDALNNREDQVKGYKNTVANLQIALEDAQSKLQRVEKERSKEVDEASYLQSVQMQKLEREVEELKKLNKKVADGEAFWKSKAERLEANAATSAIVTVSPSIESSVLHTTCSACTDKDNNIQDLESQLDKVTTTNATLTSTKATLDSRLLTLSNQHAALERSSSASLAQAKEELESLQEELGYLKMEMADNAVLAKNRLEDAQRSLGLKVKENEEIKNELKRESESSEILKEEVEELEKCNEGLKKELENNASSTTAHIDSLTSQIRDLEIAFQSSNSSLLSSRSALSHTESRLCELERLLDELQNQEKKRKYEDEFVDGLKARCEELEKVKLELEKDGEALQDRLQILLEEQHIKAAEREEKDLQVLNLEEQLRAIKVEQENCLAEHTEETTLELDTAKRALEAAQSALLNSQVTSASLTLQIENLQMETSSLRSQLIEEGTASATLAAQVEDLQNTIKERNATILQEKENFEQTQLQLSDKEDELLAITTELESLKRDATALRDQVVVLQSSALASSSSSASTHTALPSSRRKHTRATSAPFTPSPLRHASYPPHTMLPSPNFNNLPPVSEMPESSTILASQEDIERAIVLVARLRQERDEAINQLSYYVLEHTINSQTTQEELLSLQEEREQLAAEIVGLAAIVGEGEKEKKGLRIKVGEMEKKEGEAMDELEQLCKELEEMKEKYESQGPMQDTKDGHNAIADPLKEGNTTDSRSIIDALKEEINELQIIVQDRTSTVEDLLSDKDILSSSLQSTNLALIGAQNATLDLQSRLECLEAQHDTFIMSSNIEKEELEGELDYVRLYLEGAQNLVIELEEAKKSLLMEKNTLEKNLKNEITQLSRQVESEGLMRRKWETELESSKVRVADATRRIAEQEELVSSLILSLLQAGKGSSKARQISSILRDRLEKQESEVEVARDQLLQAEIAIANLHTSEVSPSQQAVTADQDHISNILIITLIEASRMFAIKKEEKRISNIEIAAESDRAATLEGQARALQDRLQIVERDLAIALAGSSTDRVLEEEVRTLQDINAELETQLQVIRASETALQADATRLQTELLQLQDELFRKSGDVHSLEAELAASCDTVAALEENLVQAEEEGKNIVQDFNMLSEEYEKRQMEDETRTMQSAQQEKRLAEAAVIQQEMERRNEETVASLRDLEARIKGLEEELENKQAEVEETDDRYLASLKTIKKQSLALDKHKVRIEALQRAIALLNSAIPKDNGKPDILAPTPSSAKKRGLPKDFVAKDPGPQAVVSGPGMQTVQMALMQKMKENQMEQDVGPDAKALEGAARQAVVERPSSNTRPAPKAPVASAPIDDEPAKRIVVPLKSAPPLTKPPSSKPDLAKGTNDKTASANNTSITPSTALASSRPRKPLASVQAQASLPQTQQSSITAKLGSLSSKTAFKPAAPGALSSKPLLAATKNGFNAAGQQTDTKSLLAALQALKKPTGGLQTR